MTEIKNINLGPKEEIKKKKRPSMGLAKKIALVLGGIVLMIAVIQIMNAAKYGMIVNVKDGENIMGVNPLGDQLDFGDLSRNNGMTRYVSLKNGGSGSVYIAALRFGDINSLVKLDKNFFALKPGEETKMSFEINIPPSAKTKKYSGWVMIFMLPKIV